MLAEDLRPRQDDPAVRADVERELGKLLADVNRRVADYEQLRMIVVAREPWSVENGLLTPTMKVRRARIEGAVTPSVETWLGDSRRVIFA